MGIASDSLNDQLLIPDLLQASPQVRPVLDRYGLRGCGGPLGPRETLGFFAKAHDVPIDRLLAEIRAQLPHPLVAEAVVQHRGDTIYRPFFKAGIVVVLTLGGAWGAYLLARIALAGSFTAAGLHEINAHGHAQIFGWVGLFVMGFAYQAFPRFKHAELAHPGLAFASLWLMLAGITARSIAEPLADALSWAWLPALTGSLLEVLAIGIFAVVIAVTWRRSGKPLALYDYYILSAMGWFLVQAVYETALLAATLAAPDHDRLVSLAATWQGPLREIQIHGFALLMILGVSQRIFHHFFELPPPDPKTSAWALGILNSAVVGEVVGLILMRTSGHAWALLWYGSALLLTAAVVLLVRDWAIFTKAKEKDRSLKFLRTAYVWLFLSLGMLVLMPVQQWLLGRLAPESPAAELGFSHAYYGATPMIIKLMKPTVTAWRMAAKVVPTLNGLEIRKLSPLWGPFVLVNVGCALRVAGQTLTDFIPALFPLTGVSGLLEVGGLAWWGVHLWRLMPSRSPAQARAASTPVLAGQPIVASNVVGEVLDHYPGLLPLFVSSGFKPLAHAAFRKTIAYRVTLATACRFLGVDVTPFLNALNLQRERQAGGKTSLPLIEV